MVKASPELQQRIQSATSPAEVESMLLAAAVEHGIPLARVDTAEAMSDEQLADAAGAGWGMDLLKGLGNGLYIASSSPHLVMTGKLPGPLPFD